MMSDYEVTLVNDNMQEFYVIFKGPGESEHLELNISEQHADSHGSTLRRWQVESPR